MKILDLYITKVCNLNCEYCYVDIVKKEASVFQTEQFLERVNLLEYDSIKFFGGEPLVRWQEIQKIVQSVYDKKKSIRFTIVTNGTLLNKEKIDFCIKYNLSLVISIHEGGFNFLKTHLEILTLGRDHIGFYILFDPKDFTRSLRNFFFFFKAGFRNFCFAPEIYGDWSKQNLKTLQKILSSLVDFIQKYNVQISGIPENSLKIINRACEKTVYNEQGKYSPCNRFKDLKTMSNFNYKTIYDLFDSILHLSQNPHRWFYVCPIGWYIDNKDTEDIQLSLETYQNLNEIFLDFYRKIHSNKINFFSQNISQIRFNLTKQCNIRCSYCYVDFKNEALDIQVGKNIIDFYLEQEGEVKKIAFFGGEPLLEFQLLQQMTFYAEEKSILFKKKIEYSLATNFTLITAEMMDFFRKYNFKIHISFNGKPAVNDILRDKSTEKVIKNMDTFLIPEDFLHICILLAFTPEGSDDIYDNLIFLIEHGFSHFNLELIFGDSYVRNEIHIQRALKGVERILEKYPHITFMNAEKSGTVLDILTDGTCGENSLGEYSSKINTPMKILLDTGIKDIGEEAASRK